MSGHNKHCSVRSRFGEGLRGIWRRSHGRNGSMKRGARGVPGAPGEAGGGLAAGDLTGRMIGLAIKVHKTVGPGLLEQIYEDCPCHEMALNGLAFQRQVELSLIYDGVGLPRGYRTAIVAGETVVLETKSINISRRFTKRSSWPICVRAVAQWDCC
jgi:GxxExxY protein